MTENTEAPDRSELEAKKAELESAVAAALKEKAVAEPGSAYPALAEAWLELSGVLQELGQPETALDAAVEGVEEYRRLFEAAPSEFMVVLASAVNTLSNRLSEVGRDEEGRAIGEQALVLAREAVDIDPDQARFVLVSVLMNQSGRSWRASEFLRAIEETGTAVEMFREGGEAMHPFMGVMVDALHRNALALAEAGHWAEAVQLRRMMIKIFPEDQAPAAINQLVALTLQQAAFALSRDGKPGEALPLVEEAAQLARDLAGAEPDQNRLFLAQSLANLACRQHEAEADEQALDSALEAVNVFQEVAQVDPASAIGPLVATLDTFAAILTTLGYEGQAQEVLNQRDTLQAAMRPVTH
ncbi:MAG TPA: tetratricopeptide repeat protein [Magnetospirillum sp.]|jgi:tetratricopeptide (TPR) repeat protein|nr:tetratricopeptide repeat protein [Magnetospirillum sp.]